MTTHLLARVPNVFSILGFGANAFVNALLSTLVRWVAAGARSLIGAFGHALNSTTTVSFGSGFSAEFAILRSFGAELVGAFLCIVTIQAVVRQDFGTLARVVGLRLPAALLFSGFGIEIVSVLLQASDALSHVLLSSSGVAFDHFVSNVASTLPRSGPGAPVIASFEGLVFALVLGVLVFLCLIELAVRSAAISIASLFIPLALAGLLWSATQHWIRRLSEVLLALVMSKVAISAVFALAISSLGIPSGINSVLEGIALFVLAAWAPFSLLRLLPFFESEGFAHFESLGHRAGQASRHLTGAVSPIIGDRFFPPEPIGAENVDGIEWAAGDPNARIEIDPEDADVFRFVEPWVVHRSPAQRDRDTRGEPIGHPPRVVMGEVAPEVDQ